MHITTNHIVDAIFRHLRHPKDHVSVASVHGVAISGAGIGSAGPQGRILTRGGSQTRCTCFCYL